MILNAKKEEMIDISPLIYTRDELLLSYFRQVFFEKEFSMNRTDVILFNFLIVSFRSIAFMLFKRVLRMALRKLIHSMISTDFS